LSDAMAGLEPALVEADAGGIAGQVLRLARRRCLVVLFTDLAAAPVEEGLMPSLAPLLRRHEVMIASVADPRVAELAAGRGNAEAVYAAAAAERAIAERARLAGLLRRRGVEVVDVVPEHFAGAVADRYLTLKAAGLL
ncbi:MAG: lipoprotein, partial [Mycobacterium sp.]|nr:lipoprotein [Mycobacterium sp.]